MRKGSFTPTIEEKSKDESAPYRWDYSKTSLSINNPKSRMPYLLFWASTCIIAYFPIFCDNGKYNTLVIYEDFDSHALTELGYVLGLVLGAMAL